MRIGTVVAAALTIVPTRARADPKTKNHLRPKSFNKLATWFCDGTRAGREPGACLVLSTVEAGSSENAAKK
jgi:hypothetical protein